jgi:diamine N-acetyltransferase
VFQAVHTDEDIDEVVKIAHPIWIEHYTPIIGIEQVEYMLENLHSKENIKEDIVEKGYLYFLIKTEQTIGYIGLQISEDKLFLSKIYIASGARGQGVGRLAMDYIKSLAKQHKLKKISLTVNKNNTDSITAYQKIGFAKTADVCADIGGGFVMDDYLMELEF